MKKTGDSRYIYQSELDKGGFQHDMPYRDSKRTVSDKVNCHKVFNLGKTLKRDGCERVLTSVLDKFFLIKYQKVLIKLVVVLLRIKLCQINN